jgi:hypothetical protein
MDKIPFIAFFAIFLLIIGIVVSGCTTSQDAIMATPTLPPTYSVVTPTPEIVYTTQTFSSATTEQNSVTNPPTSSVTSSSQTNVNELSTGKTGTDGIIQITVNGEQFVDKLPTTYSLGQDVPTSEIGDQYLILDLTVKDVDYSSGFEHQILPWEFGVTDSDGNSYGFSQDTMYMEQGWSGVALLGSGGKFRNYFAFEVPINPNGLKLTYNDGNGKTVVISL